ncbi:uncharacterized protein LOC133661290 [Entelurus aequoreus]|uniref:uncharacterized protein LOC133661290 n=1 Tax=Entelurus aequoreus TaxID=161455 RepID=UPI002B1E88FB|nr:uncharacterized protein LOC133661290 [Entelurus aequoreus]
MRLGPEDRPFALAQQLRDVATRSSTQSPPGRQHGCGTTVPAQWRRLAQPEGATWTHEQGTGAADRLPPQTAPRTPGPVCWGCGQPGHVRRDCSLMEVGQVMRVVGPPAHATDPGETYCVPADASGRGLGAVLSQRVGGIDRPVLYISRKLSDREARYSTVERECLAIRWAVGALRYYLLGRAFALCSDHKPLQWLHRMKDANARITRLVPRGATLQLPGGPQAGGSDGRGRLPLAALYGGSWRGRTTASLRLAVEACGGAALVTAEGG